MKYRSPTWSQKLWQVAWNFMEQPHTGNALLHQEDLVKILSSISANPIHDDLLFIAIAFTGWHCLMQLGELLDPDTINLQDYQKTITHWSVSYKTSVLEQCAGLLDPLPIFQNYLASHNWLFCPFPKLWLKPDSCIPSQSWFINKLKVLFPEEEVSGHSLCSGGDCPSTCWSPSELYSANWALVLWGIPILHPPKSSPASKFNHWTLSFWTGKHFITVSLTTNNPFHPPSDT